MHTGKLILITAAVAMLSGVTFAQDKSETPKRLIDPAAEASEQTSNVKTYAPANTVMHVSPAFTSGEGILAPQETAGEIDQAKQGASSLPDRPAEKQMQDLFNDIDADHNGLITKTEFSMYYKTTADDPRFLGYDVNKDMNISYFEFRAPNVTGSSAVIPRN